MIKKWKLTFTIFIFGTILFSPKVSAKNLSSFSDLTIKLPIVAQSPLKDAVVYFHRGLNRYTFGDLEGAIIEYNQALILYPKFAEVYYQRGISRHKLRDLQGAIADFNQAINISSHYPGMYNNRGLVHHDLRDYQKAIADFNQALLLNPNFPEAYQNRAITRHSLGNKQGAISDLNAAANLFQTQKRIKNYQEVIDLITTYNSQPKGEAKNQIK
ncbi:MAG: tetratricopeptide repeat protein [Cuspidothrix sp.]